MVSKMPPCDSTQVICILTLLQGYEGPMNSTSTLRSTAIGSTASFDSLKSTDPFAKSPRLARRQLEEIPEGPSKYN